MLTNQIAAGVTAVILAISGVALTAGDDTAAVEANAAGQVAASGSTAVTVNDSTMTTIGDDDSTSTTVDDSTSTTIDDDDRTSTTAPDDDSTSTTTPDDDSTSTTTPDDSDARQVVELGMRSYTVGSAGTVVMDGMVLVGVTTNPGWTVEIEESSADKVKVEFENGEAEAEFELRIDGRLEIKTQG